MCLDSHRAHHCKVAIELPRSPEDILQKQEEKIRSMTAKYTGFQGVPPKYAESLDTSRSRLGDGWMNHPLVCCTITSQGDAVHHNQRLTTVDMHSTEMERAITERTIKLCCQEKRHVLKQDISQPD